MPYDEAKQPPQTDGVPSVNIQRRLSRATGSKDLSGGALSVSAGILTKFKITQVLVHASQVLSDTRIVVSFDTLTGANYDTVIGVAGFNGGQNVPLIAGDNLFGAIGDEGDDIVISSEGTDAVGILYYTVMWERLT